MPTMLETLKTYKGLPHRCENIAEIDGVLYIDDSKGTNVGATQAALQGFGRVGSKNLILIAGGQGKEQNFADLQPAAKRFVKQALLFGEDAAQLNVALQDACATQQVESLQQAVDLAYKMAVSGDIVLLSPACASFDMFSGFEERGRCFQQAVAELQKRGGQPCS